MPRLQLENGTGASLDGDILLKWTHYSQERLGPLLLFAQNSKVTAAARVGFAFAASFVLFRNSRTGREQQANQRGAGIQYA